MALSIGIVGLPNAGKSTVFNALTRASVAVAAYPFTTIDPHHGVVPVPDQRIEAIAAVTHPDRTVPAAVDFVDIAGLVRGASKGEGLGNQFLAQVREVSALAHVVRCFTDPDVTHVEGALDPVRDIEVVEAELALADLATVEGEIDRLQSRVKAHEVQAVDQRGLLAGVADQLKRGMPVRQSSPNPDRDALLNPFRLLTAKPVLYVANVDESDLPDGGPAADRVRAYAAETSAAAVVLAAKLEAEAAALPPEEAAEFLSSYGLKEPALPTLARAAYGLLDLVTFFSTASKEVRAWAVPRGTKASGAAGVIHTDMERGFIRAEVINWETLVQAGSLRAAHDQGRVRLEGRDYVMMDGDVILFRFAV